MCLCWGCVCLCGDQKMSDSLELESQDSCKLPDMGDGTEIRSSGRVVSLKHLSGLRFNLILARLIVNIPLATYAFH